MKKIILFLTVLLSTLLFSCTGDEPTSNDGWWDLTKITVDGQERTLNDAISIKVEGNAISVYSDNVLDTTVYYQPTSYGLYSCDSVDIVFLDGTIKYKVERKVTFTDENHVTLNTISYYRYPNTLDFVLDRDVLSYFTKRD